jgi:hypothetical protein
MSSLPWRGARSGPGRTARAAALILAAALPSCSGNYDNPFANSNQTVPPPANASIVFASNTYAARPGSGLELFAMESSGAGVTRLTLCNTADRRCDYVEPIPSVTRTRLAVRRILDTDNDSRITATDGESLRIIDLARAVEGELVSANAHVSGADWSPGEEILYYSGVGQTAADDLFQVTSNGQSTQNLTMTTGLRERRPRFNIGGTSLAFERIEASGKGQVWLATSLGLRGLTTGGPGSDVLAGTPYVVGSDADPVFSPDGRLVLFRRLVATGNGGLGLWEYMTIRTDQNAATPTTFLPGNVYRGAPDWNATGIVFVEVAPGAGPQLVFVDATGGGRRVLMTAGAGFQLAYPHWLR